MRIQTIIIFTLSLFYHSIQAKSFMLPTDTIRKAEETFVSQGENMPDCDLIDINNKTCRLSDYLGKYILLCFWDSHCRHCINSIPELDQISKKHKDLLTIISINVDKNQNIWKIVSKNKITWVNLWNKGGYKSNLCKQYEVTGFPHYFWISPEGKVLTTWKGYGGPLSIVKQVEPLLEKKETFQILGTISHLPEGTVFTLSEKQGNEIIPIAKDTVKGQSIQFKGKTIKNTVLYLSCSAPQQVNQQCPIWIAPNSIIKVYSKNDSLEKWYVCDDSQSPTGQAELNFYISATLSLSDSIQYIEKEIQNLSKKEPFNSNLLIHKKQLIKELITKELEIMKQRPATRVSLYKLYDYITCYQSEIIEFQDLCKQQFNRLPKGEQQSIKGQAIYTFFNK